MKKNFKSYAIIWAVLFAVFNIVVFLARPVIPGMLSVMTCDSGSRGCL